MVMDWLGYLLGSVVVVDILTHLLLPYKRRSNNAQAQKEETDADLKREEMHEKIEEFLQNQLLEKERRFNDQTDRLREVQRDLVAANERELALTRENGELKLEIEWHRQWHCSREQNETEDGCKRREPEQKIPLKYVPFKPR